MVTFTVSRITRIGVCNHLSIPLPVQDLAET